MDTEVFHLSLLPHKKGIEMYELLELFNEMIKFEEGMSNYNDSKSTKAMFTRDAFKTYTEERFNQIKNLSSSGWLDDIKQLKCA